VESAVWQKQKDTFTERTTAIGHLGETKGGGNEEGSRVSQIERGEQEL